MLPEGGRVMTDSRFAVVTSMHAYLYMEAGSPEGENSSEVSDDIFSGWAVRILEDFGAWVYVLTHYGYKGYVLKKDLREISREELMIRQDKERYFRICYPLKDVLKTPKVQGNHVEELVRNSLVELLSHEEEGWSRIRTASGKEGYLQSVSLTERKDDDTFLLEEKESGKAEDGRIDPSDGHYFAERMQKEKEKILESGLSCEEWEKNLRDNIVKTALSYMGTQYRWGGKSPLGIDCSGLAFMSYMENGILIYRDADIKEEYPLKEISRENLKKGDLIFFPGHVAVYIGEDRYVHSTGYKMTPGVTINSLNLHDTLYRDDLAHKITAFGSVFDPAGSRKHEESVPDGSGQNAASALRDDQRTDLSSQESEGVVRQILMEQIQSLPGNVSFFYKDLTTGQSAAFREKEGHEAASIIKLYLMAAMFQGFEDGDFSPSDKLTIKREDCVPSCGVLNYLDDGKEVSLRDLVELMIIVSDNTACNVLYDFYGEDRIKTYIRDRLGCTDTRFVRKMFDSARASRGIDNYTTAADTASLLEKIWKGELVSKDASRQMLNILEDQRLNGKIPFYLHPLKPRPVIAHKTGENDGVTHDVAIVEGKNPFMLCFLCNEVDAPAAERMMAETSFKVYEYMNGKS